MMLFGEHFSAKIFPVPKVLGGSENSILTVAPAKRQESSVPVRIKPGLHFKIQGWARLLFVFLFPLTIGNNNVALLKVSPRNTN